ncbi:MAG: hypothetical protein GY901_11765 [Actinomycetia bacterium]|nr:hypothetical protein [Actinomycetes bacterium]
MPSKGDTVQIIAGGHTGRKGIVDRVYALAGEVVVNLFDGPLVAFKASSVAAA